MLSTIKCHVFNIAMTTLNCLGKDEDEDKSYFDLAANPSNNSPSKLDCADWVKNEFIKYTQGLKNLCSKRNVPMLVYQYGGRLDLEPCDVALWSAAAASYDLTIKGTVTVIT